MDFMRKTATPEQLDEMLEFMKEHPLLARAQCRRNASKFWALLAKRVNAIGNGPSKSAIQWSKVWADLKYRTRRKAWALKGYQEDSGDMPLEDTALLTAMEEEIIKLVGEKEFEDVIVKKDPLSAAGAFDRPADEESDNDNDEDFSNPLEPETELIKNERSLTPQGSETPSGSQRQKRSTDSRSDGPHRKRLLRSSHEANGDARKDLGESDEVEAFLQLEKQKLESTERLTEAVLGVKEELSRTVDVLTQIKDIIMNSFKT